MPDTPQPPLKVIETPEGSITFRLTYKKIVLGMCSIVIVFMSCATLIWKYAISLDREYTPRSSFKELQDKFGPLQHNIDNLTPKNQFTKTTQHFQNLITQLLKGDEANKLSIKIATLKEVKMELLRLPILSQPNNKEVKKEISELFKERIDIIESNLKSNGTSVISTLPSLDAVMPTE